jgi:hypothetical protein
MRRASLHSAQDTRYLGDASAHFPLCAAPGVSLKTDQAGRIFEPQASSRPDRFLSCRQGEAEGLQSRACFLWFISLHAQRKNLPPGNPGLSKPN